MYANNEPSSWEVVPAAEDSAADTFANSEGQEMITAEDIHGQLDPQVAGELNSGLLMSFLTDFRCAEYEEIRKQREAELAKTRRRTPRPLPRPELDDEVVTDDEPVVYAEPSIEWEPAPETEAEADGQWEPQQVAPPTELNGDDFLSAASHAEQPERKFRLPFGIAGSKAVRESPATT